MSIVSPPVSSPPPVSGTVRMTLDINGSKYTCMPAVGLAHGERGFWLRNRDNRQRYFIHQAANGIYSCECGDWIFRRSDTGSFCKHLAALATFGMIDAEGGAGC